MKRRRGINWTGIAIILSIAALAACTDSNVGPVFDSHWASKSAPVITNAAEAAPVVFTPEIGSDMYEKIQWNAPDYGDVALSTTYVIQVSLTKDFSGKVNALNTTPGQSYEGTNDAINNSALSLGLSKGEKDTLFFRVSAMLTALPSDTVYSNVLQRIVTVYKNSSCGTYCAFGIIGSATPGSWDFDTDMTIADPADLHTWTTTLFLVGGQEAKFRSSHAWDINWGGSTFAAGTGVPNGGNIPVANSGYYKVTFNDETLAYTFTAVAAPELTVVGLIGSSTIHGWDSDTDMTKSSDVHRWSVTSDLITGEAKFRANHDWGTNWGGGAQFPSGVGVQNGDNIPVANANTYHVVFNDATGVYYFGTQGVAFEPMTTMGIIGAATAGGWDADTNMTKNPSDPYLWSTFITVTDGELKFRANGAWDINWGASDFPSGVGSQGGNNIPVKAGKYFVTFNTLTGQYTFLN